MQGFALDTVHISAMDIFHCQQGCLPVLCWSNSCWEGASFWFAKSCDEITWSKNIVHEVRCIAVWPPILSSKKSLPGDCQRAFGMDRKHTEWTCLIKDTIEWFWPFMVKEPGRGDFSTYSMEQWLLCHPQRWVWTSKIRKYRPQKAFI